MNARLLTTTLILCAAACQSQPPAPKPEANSKPPQSETPLARARQLALETPTGGTPVDKMILDQEKKLARLPKKLDLWILLGQAWVRKARESADPGYYLNADACAEVALDLSPGSPLALNLRALSLMNAHRFKEAKAVAERTLAQDHDDIMALGTLSDAELELGHVDEAEQAAATMMDKKPSLPSYSRASYLRWLNGDSASAKQAIRLAFDAGRGQRDREPATWALVQAAMIFWQDGDYAGAEAGFDLALQYFPGFPPALVGKGRVALSRGEPARAIPPLSQALESSPTPVAAWLLGDAMTSSGDQAGAAKAYALVETLGRQTDKHTLALYWATRRQHLEDALALVGEEKKGRGDIYTDDAEAWVLHRLGRDSEARAAIDHATRLGTQDALLLFHAGAIHLATGDRAGAKKLLERALALNPHFDPIGSAEAAQLLNSRS